MKIRPLQGNLLVLLDEPVSVISGIIIPEGAQEEAVTGKVLEVGIWRQNKHGNLIPFPARKGERVVVHRYRGKQVRNDDARLRLMDMDDILAVLL